MVEEVLQPCMIYVDKNGKWFHKGVEMIHRDFILLFYKNLELDSLGNYIINWQGDRCFIEVEDTPFIVKRVRCEGDKVLGVSCFTLHLCDETQEELSPDTLYVGKDNVLYCRIRENSFPARFDRAAYYQLAEYIEEEDGEFFLPVNNERFSIKKGL